MNVSVDLVNQAPPPGWSLKGFAPSIETDGKKNWRTVIGKEAEIHFVVPKGDLYQIEYKYFTVVKPLKINAYVDAHQIDSTVENVIVNGYGYNIVKLSEGRHILKFNFNNLRKITSKSQDKRPVPMAFLQLRISEKENANGIMGADGLLISVILCLLLILLTYHLLLKRKAVDSNNHPK